MKLLKSLQFFHCEFISFIYSEFEKELLTYAGDDPLDVWHRYVCWVEQNYPTGGAASNLKSLLEKCFTTMNANNELLEKYKNDSRFLELWIKYVSISVCILILTINYNKCLMYSL